MLADKTHEFAPLAERHRRYSQRIRISLVFFFPWLALCGVQLAWKVLPIEAEPWLYALGICAFSVCLLVALTRPTLACPSCRGGLEYASGAYCPECGSDGLAFKVSPQLWCLRNDTRRP